MFCNDVLVNWVNFWMNVPTADKIKQTRKTSAIKSYYNFCPTFAMVHRVEIAFLFISLERLRLEGEQILLELEQ